MGSGECYRRASESVSCPCYCVDQAALAESLLEAWRKDRDGVGALSCPCRQDGDTPLGSYSLLVSSEGILAATVASWRAWLWLAARWVPLS